MLMVTPEEIEKERETVISCRDEIRRLESKLRLQGQRYMMLKVAVDSACRKHLEHAADGGGGDACEPLPRGAPASSSFAAAVAAVAA